MPPCRERVDIDYMPMLLLPFSLIDFAFCHAAVFRHYYAFAVADSAAAYFFR